MMEKQLSIAVCFIGRKLIEKYPEIASKMDPFQISLIERLKQNYRSHWNPKDPMVGSGFRSIRLSSDYVDTKIIETVLNHNFCKEWFLRSFTNTTIFIDPGIVVVQDETAGNYILVNEEGKKLPYSSQHYRMFTLDQHTTNPKLAFYCNNLVENNSNFNRGKSNPKIQNHYEQPQIAPYFQPIPSSEISQLPYYCYPYSNSYPFDYEQRVIFGY